MIVVPQRRTGCHNPLANWLCLAFLCFSFTGTVQPLSAASTNSLPTLDEALWSKKDAWGLAAMRQPNGPSYEFFRDLLPPLRYVNAMFHHYPIVLSAPGSLKKARLVSNGSAVNPRAGLKTWRESGFPVMFMVGNGTNAFGEDLRKLQGPHYEKGYLPIVLLSYESEGNTYGEETFASVDSGAAEYGVVFTRFKLNAGKNGKVSVRVDAKGPFVIVGDSVCNTEGEILVRFDKKWNWNAAKQMLASSLEKGESAALMIASKPMPVNLPGKKRSGSFDYEKERKRCETVWQDLLDRGMQLEVPEPIVNNAWRSLQIGNFIMVEGDKPNYSWGNAYERLYQAECGDMARAFLLWGYTDEARRMIPPLLDYTRDKLQFHNAGFKLQTLSHYYWLTRDVNFINAMRGRWVKEVKRIAEGREQESGLAPRENYCGDISTPVYSLHSNAAGWRGLRDFSAVLDEVGEHGEANRLAGMSRDYRQKIFAAVDKSERKDVQPHFLPIAMFGEEKPYDPLTSSMLGSYWNLIAPYVLGSGLFGPGSEREKSMLDYLQDKGGILMGMIRFDQHSGLFANSEAVDDLYGLRYVTTLLRLDQPDRALVSFYGKLAHGMTRDTFIGAEGTGLRATDEFGRPMYLPPNSAANAHFLWTLRYLLIQDWDMDDNGTPDTLRLLFATPRQWLRDGQTIRIEHAPTAFGEVSVVAHSHLKLGEVTVDVTAPKRQMPKQTLLRIRLPDGRKVISARVGSQKLSADDQGTVDISGFKGKFTVHLQAGGPL
ncbi:MAG: hypothetical protein JWQ71_1629 [Pedosphaera sp.]|nr:hypothetical protein [Pedosphaera sp.]